MAQIVTVILRENGVGSTVMIDDVPIEGVVSVELGQSVGEKAWVLLELSAPVVVVKAETDEVNIENGVPR